MTVRESAFLFDCEGEELVGIIAEPEGNCADVGVLVIVGGPQYRVGSHRQFVLLARQLAKDGLACMRFDYRGMGDATGEQRDFEFVQQDIRAAIDAFCARVQSVKRVVLWGLCDGASAACFYVRTDDRVVGSVLLNPWVKTAAGEARTYLKYYYLKRLVSRGFWKKLLGGGVSVISSLRGAVSAARAASGAKSATLLGSSTSTALPERMGQGLRAACKPFCLILSGRDYVAREFEGVISQGGTWQVLAESSVPVLLPSADHTFSSAAWRHDVAEQTVEWVRGLDATIQEQVR